MPRVLIECPETGELIPTGVELKEEEFAASNLRNKRVDCPECGRTHVWQIEDAILEPTP